MSGGSAEEGAPRTVAEFLRRASRFLEAKGIASSRLDAEVLLAHALGLRRLDLYLQFERPLAAAEVDAYRRMLQARGRRVPVAYVTGEREFFSLRFRVNPSVLVPRPETEILVEEALRFARARAGESTLAADVGTGSGCVAIALARSLPSIRVVAIDRSPGAIGVARENAAAHGVGERVAFLRANYLDALAGRAFDLVVSNPPYVDPDEKGTLAPDVADHEPAEALFAPAGDPLAPTREIARAGARVLRPGGAMFLEIGAGRREAVEAELAAAGLPVRAVRRDLAGIERVVRSDAV